MKKSKLQTSRKASAVSRCLCGSVELQAIGTPILSSACYCDDCQRGSHQIEMLRNAPPVLSADGGTQYVLYRKDRIQCTKGDRFLQDYRLGEKSPTKRVVASCCNSAMFLNFEKGHWLSMYRDRLRGDIPPLQMRIQTKSKPGSSDLAGDVPSYAGFPLKFIVKLMAAQVAMLLHR